MNSIVSVPAYFVQSWDMRPTLFHIELVHNSAFIFNRSLYHEIFPVVSQLIWFDVGSTFIFSFSGLCKQSSLCLCVFFSAASILNMLCAFLNVVTWLTLLVLDLVLYLCVPVIYTLMHIFGIYSTSGITWGCGSDVPTFIFPILIFDNFPFSWCNCWIFLGWKF